MNAELFTPIELKSVRLKNRVVISPMCQYSAHEGVAHDWHFVHLGRFAIGGASAVFVEATAVTPEGRITHGCTGLWNDAQMVPFKHIAAFIKSQNCVPGIQLAHAGRKASAQRPWEGGTAIKETNAAGEGPWQTVAPSAIPFGPHWPTPRALMRDDLEQLRKAWRAAVERALRCGFEMLELHFAHGYLMNEFLSPLANARDDDYGGNMQKRMRFPLEIVDIARAAWPKDKPLFVRISAVDDGWSIEDSIVFAKELKARDVDVVDCSSGGINTVRRVVPEPGYQVPFAERIRLDAGIKTMAVGLITEPRQAEDIIKSGRADLVALAREALADSQWALHARRALSDDPLDFEDWPVQAASRLKDRERARLKST